MIDYIKQESKSTSQKNAKKVDALFSNIMISFIKHSEYVIEVVLGQHITRGIVRALKHQHYVVSDKCYETQFLCTRIYPSICVIVDGLNTNKLFTAKQATSTNVQSTDGNDAHLASIATSMPTTLSTKNAAKHTDTDKEENINYNNMLKDI